MPALSVGGRTTGTPGTFLPTESGQWLTTAGHRASEAHLATRGTAKRVITNSHPGKRHVTVEAPGIDLPGLTGSETVVELRDLLAGTYTFICRLV